MQSLNSAILVGVTLDPGTYRYALGVEARASVILTMKPSTVTGACTARVYTPLARSGVGENESVAATSIPLTEDVQTETTVTATGERAKVLELFVPGGGALAFDVIEFRAPVTANDAPGVNGSKNVTEAGTPETLTDESQPAGFVVISARPGNAGVIAVAFEDTVSAVTGSESGMLLSPGQTVGLPCTDLQRVWLDASDSGDGVSFLSFR